MRLPILLDRKDCTLCPLHQTARSVGVRGVREYGLPPTWADTGLPVELRSRNSLTPGPGVPAVIFIGRNPNRLDDAQNFPFSGKPGAILRNGFVVGSNLPSLASVYYLNTVRCATTADANPNFKTHIKPCFPHLLADLKEIIQCHAPPKTPLLNGPIPSGISEAGTNLSEVLGSQVTKLAVVCLGGLASQAFLQLAVGEKKPDSQSEAFRNNAREVKWEGHNIFLLHTYHPAYCLRNPNCGQTVDEHMTVLTSWLKGELVAPSKPRFAKVRFPS